jgi:hypothetical protein
VQAVQAELLRLARQTAAIQLFLGCTLCRGAKEPPSNCSAAGLTPQQEQTGKGRVAAMVLEMRPAELWVQDERAEHLQQYLRPGRADLAVLTIWIFLPAL